MKIARILGVPFSTRDMPGTIIYLTEQVEKHKRTHVVTANPEVVMIAVENPVFMRIMNQAYVVPDGIGIVYAAKWLRLPITERVTGIELMDELMQVAHQKAWRVYLFGASPQVNEQAAQTLSIKYPQAQIVGCRDGFFQKQDEAAIAEQIAEAKPDLLFVAMGAPKQDEWIATHWERLQVPLAMGVGGSFDVIAGKVKRAPVLWQRLHVEWLYRLVTQPSRWRRQIALPRFAIAVVVGLGKRKHHS